MAVTAGTINARVELAITAIDAADWATAETKLLGALAALTALPDTRHGDSELRWNREALQELLKNVRSRGSVAGGTMKLQETKVSHVRVTD